MEGGGIKTGPLRKKTYFEARKKIRKKMWSLSLRGGDKALVAGPLKTLFVAASQDLRKILFRE